MVNYLLEFKQFLRNFWITMNTSTPFLKVRGVNKLFNLIYKGLASPKRLTIRTPKIIKTNPKTV